MNQFTTLLNGFHILIGAFITALVAGCSCPLQAAVFTLALSGDPSPSFSEKFSKFGIPVINDAGNVAFSAELALTPTLFTIGLFVSSPGSTNLAFIQRENFHFNPELYYRRLFLEDAGEDRLIYGDLWVENQQIPSLGDPYRLGFTAYMADLPDRHLYLDGPSRVKLASREWTANPPMNDHGQMLNEPDSQHYQLLEGTNITEIARVDFVNPTNFSYLGLPALNDHGEVAFLAMPANQAPDPNFREVILVSAGQTRRLWERGDPAPDGNGTFAFARNDVLLNNRSEVVFNASLMGTALGDGDNDGIFRATTNSVQQLIRAGQELPNGSGVFSGGFHLPSVNDRGQIVVFANIGQSGVVGDHGLFMADGTNVAQLARLGDPSPDGDGHFALEAQEDGLYGESEFNNQGQLAFKAYFGPAGGPFNEEGLIFMDSDGTRHLIARKGQTLAGSTIVSVRILGENDDIRPINRRGGRKAMNERGAVVYRCTLADNRQGIFVWRRGPQEPTVAIIRSASLAGDRIVFRVPSDIGFRYQIQYRSSLRLGGWNYHDRFPLQEGTGGDLDLSFGHPPEHALQRYYRLVVTHGW